MFINFGRSSLGFFGNAELWKKTADFNYIEITLKDLAPSYLSDFLHLYTPSRQLQSSSDTRLFRIPTTRSKACEDPSPINRLSFGTSYLSHSVMLPLLPHSKLNLKLICSEHLFNSKTNTLLFKYVDKRKLASMKGACMCIVLTGRPTVRWGRWVIWRIVNYSPVHHSVLWGIAMGGCVLQVDVCTNVWMVIYDA